MRGGCEVHARFMRGRYEVDTRWMRGNIGEMGRRSGGIFEELLK